MTANPAARYLDLSHIIFDGLVTYKGLPAPVICDFLSREDSRKFYEAGTEFQIGRLDMVANTGTYLDCPFHRYADGQDLAQLALEALVDLEGLSVRAPNTTAIGVEYFEGKDLRNRAVLVHTGWARHWNTEQYFEGHPFLTAEAAEYLRQHGAKLVGIDSHNIDDTTGKTRPVHSTLLGAGILIVEHLCHLEQVPDEGFWFTAVPPKVEGMGTFPVRAYAKVS